MPPVPRKLYTLLSNFTVNRQDTADWEKAIRAELIAILIMGLLTIWQVAINAPPFLFEGAVSVYVGLVVLTLFTWFRLLWIYLVDGLLGLGLVILALVQPEYLTVATGGIGVLPTFIFIVGDALALVLGMTSLYVFWVRFSPRIEEQVTEHRKVHENCDPNAPCRTSSEYRV